MNLKRLVGFLVIIFVLFWIISKPSSAGGTVNDMMGNLRDAGDHIVTFIDKIV